MTEEEVQQTGEAYKAYLREDPTPIQGINGLGHWVDTTSCIDWNYKFVRRIKPEPKRVPLTQADMLLDRPVWIRNGQCDNCPSMVIGFDSLGVRIVWHIDSSSRCTMFHRTYQDLFDRWEITFDGGKTWGPCSKQSQE